MELNKFIELFSKIRLDDNLRNRIFDEVIRSSGLEDRRKKVQFEFRATALELCKKYSVPDYLKKYLTTDARLYFSKLTNYTLGHNEVQLLEKLHSPIINAVVSSNRWLSFSKVDDSDNIEFPYFGGGIGSASLISDLISKGTKEDINIYTCRLEDCMKIDKLIKDFDSDLRDKHRYYQHLSGVYTIGSLISLKPEWLSSVEKCLIDSGYGNLIPQKSEKNDLDLDQFLRYLKADLNLGD